MKQIGCKRPSSNCGGSSRSEESIELPLSHPKGNHFIGEWNKVANDQMICAGGFIDFCFSWPQHYLKCSLQHSDFFLYLTRG